MALPAVALASEGVPGFSCEPMPFDGSPRQIWRTGEERFSAPK